MLKTVITITLLMMLWNLCASQQESFEFGKGMYRDGFYQEAALVFERIVNSTPSSPEAEESIYLLGEINKRLGNFGAAESYYRRFYETYPASSQRENALYNWSMSLYEQGKYSAAIELFNGFIDSYPNSINRANTNYHLIDSYYQISAHQSVISRGQQFIREFTTNPEIPDVMLKMAHTYMKTNQRNDADNTFNMIIRDYPQSDARWEAVIIQGKLVFEEKGLQPALDHLKQQINQTMPRQYEEIIHKEIADLYLITRQYENALESLNLLVSKFDRSERLAEYLNNQAESLNQLSRYQNIINIYERADILHIIDTPYFFDYLIKVAGAYFQVGRSNKTEAIISDISYGVEDENHRYGVLYWQARLKEQGGLLLDVINSYHFLMANYPTYASNEQLLMRIGDIYFDKMQMYQSAINYYNQIITGVGFDSSYHWIALYKTALCYEIIGDYPQALKALRQINIDYVEGETNKKDILNRIEIISQFKSVDHEKVSSNLISLLFQYANDDDKDKLKDQLITTMLIEMKDIDGVLALLEGDTSSKSVYLRGKAYVKALHKADLEMKTGEKRLYFDRLNAQINTLNSRTNPEYVDELVIERDYIANSYTLSPQNLSKAENFVSAHRQAAAVNRFRFLIGYQYLKNGVFVKADQYLSMITRDSEIPSVQYEEALLRMGNYFFDNGQYDKVITYFDKLDPGLTINKAEELYRYAVSLIRMGNREQGLGRLDFLVKNTSSFQSRKEAIDMLADHYREQNAYHDVVYLMLLYPEGERNKEYYLRLSDDYLEINDKLKAKEALMHIIDKDVPTLLKLADLHYQTDDIFMAEFTYNQLLKDVRDKESRLIVQSRLGHLYFIEENWREAIANYDPVLNELGERINTQQYSYLDLVTIGKEAVISLYRVQNRPRADTIKQRFQNILRNEPVALAEIELHEAIYQMTVNRSRAETGFNNLIRNQNLPNELIMQAYFWRGVNHLENKKVNEAKTDFQRVLQSNDWDLLNQAHLKLGTINFSQQQYQKSLEHYYLVMANDYDGDLAFDAAKNYAIVCKTVEEWQRAIEAYEIILERWGDSGLEGEILFNIAYCQYRDRKYIEAIRNFEKALPLITDRELKAEAQYWIGESYFSLNQFDNAATEYLKVGYFYPEYPHWNAISELKLAESYLRQGRTDNARQILNNVIQKFGRDSDWGRQATAYLEQL